MLESIRKIAHKPAFKIVFAVLIIAFAASGISGLSMGFGGGSYEAKVGSVKITSEEIDARYKKILSSLGPQAAILDEAQLAQLGVSRKVVLNNVVKGTLVQEEVKDIGIVIGERSIIAQIKKMPIFYDEKGAFSVERFNLFLEKMNLTEASLKKDIQIDIQNLILAGSVLSNTPKNILVARAVSEAINSKRELEIIKIPASSMHLNTEPTKAELDKFYFESSELFKLPETRDVSVIKIAKPDAEDKAVFDKITKITDQLAGGANIAEVATAHALTIEQQPQVLAGSGKVSEVVFGLKESQTSQLTENEDGSYFIAHVNKINAASVPDIETVKDKVVALYKADKASSEAIKFAQNILVEAKSGKGLQKLAAEKNLTYTHVPQFSSDDETYGQEFVMTTFNTPAGEVTGVIPTSDNGYIFAKVLKIIPASATDAQVADAMEKGAEIFKQEIFQQYMKYLEGKHKIVIKEPKAAAPAKS